MSMNRSEFSAASGLFSSRIKCGATLPDDAFDRAIFRVDDDALSLGDGRVNTAHFADVNKTLVGNKIH